MIHGSASVPVPAVVVIATIGKNPFLGTDAFRADVIVPVESRILCNIAMLLAESIVEPPPRPTTTSHPSSLAVSAASSTWPASEFAFILS